MTEPKAEPIAQFLGFLGGDIDAGNVVPLEPDLLGRLAALVDGADVDLDGRLPPDCE